MRNFFERQRVDEIGLLAVKVETTALFTLLLYIIYILLAFVLASVYGNSMIGVIFSFFGLLVVVGFIGAVRREHVLMCFYVAIIALELVLALVGTVLWLMTVVVLITNANFAPSAIDAVTNYSPVALVFALILVFVNPILVLLNIYSLSLSARLKRLLCAEKIAKLEILQQVQVREMVHSLLQQEMQTISVTKMKGKSKSKAVKLAGGNSGATSPILKHMSPDNSADPSPSISAIPSPVFLSASSPAVFSRFVEEGTAAQ